MKNTIEVVVMAGMDIVCEKFMMGSVPRFSAETKVLDKEEVAPFKELYLVEKGGKKYIVAVKYQGFGGDDGGFAAMVWKVEVFKKYAHSVEELFEAIDEAIDLMLLQSKSL
ncbi:MAG: hypothetical protein H0Z19_10345 [Archaeoglobus sp.]|uniref:hypothetical protein n=1 Tax=Archaeoglobus sp. TaxID=1872626 RepID=UPI001D528392|nr:hypothetical protein [Archaeoglobus sp.]MBO8180853.1 hypothetical protein [Archaeoglobus sp.]